MSNDGALEARRIVTCDGCGTPYAAMVGPEGVVIVGHGSGECPNCAGTEFSTLTL